MKRYNDPYICRDKPELYSELYAESEKSRIRAAALFETYWANKRKADQEAAFMEAALNPKDKRQGDLFS